MNDKELVYEVFRLDDWRCVVCGSNLKNNLYAQRAHVLSQGKRMRKRYGNEVIDNTSQQFATCSLECNKKLSIGYAYPLLMDRIAELTRQNKREEILEIVLKHIQEKEKGV